MFFDAQGSSILSAGLRRQIDLPKNVLLDGGYEVEKVSFDLSDSLIQSALAAGKVIGGRGHSFMREWFTIRLARRLTIPRGAGQLHQGVPPRRRKLGKEKLDPQGFSKVLHTSEAPKLRVLRDVPVSPEMDRSELNVFVRKLNQPAHRFGMFRHTRVL